MTYEEFLDKCKQCTKINDLGYREYIDDIKEKFYKPNDRKERKYGTKYGITDEPRFDFIIESIKIGGVEGGSCWESSNPHNFSTGEHFPSVFEALDAIIEGVCPTINYKEYLNIGKTILQIGDATDYQYYGNRDDYQYRYIKLEELYKYLYSRGLLT